MAVLHGTWSAVRRLCVWGEDEDATGLPSGGRSHPFALSAEALAGLADEHGWRCAEPASLRLLLPSRRGGPLPSPELGRPARDGAVAPRPWSVPALALGPDAALDALLAIPSPAGASLRFLAEAAKLALELVARGRVLPALEADEGGRRFVARWRVSPEPDDARRLRLLATAMPAACRAESGDDRPPRAVVEDFVAALADAAARRGAAFDLPSRPRVRMPAAEAWLRALSSPDAVVGGDPIELGALRQRVEAWRQPAAAGPPPDGMRLCIRVAPPDPPRRSWKLEFLLQAADDPSLLVPAAEVWRARGPLATLERPQERLLAELGRASALCPPLEPALSGRRPVELALDAAGAHRFLREDATLLAHSGFGVLVPPWWHQAQARLGLRLRARPAAAAVPSPVAATPPKLGLEALVAYEWEVALGDTVLRPAELRELARLKVPLVQVRGRWVELRPEDLAAALSLLEQPAAERVMTLAELLRTATGLDETAAEGPPVVAVEAEGWVADVLAGAEDRRVEAEATPAGFQGDLRPYQRRGLAWLRYLGGLGLGACLADDMGLGKTVQLLALLVAERAEGALPPPTLLVCPMSVAGNWQREAARFAPSLRVHVHHGHDRVAGEELAETVRGCDLVVTTYGLAVRDQEALTGLEWGRVVLDEAQNVKNSAARQAQAVRAVRAPQRVALTGTPVENRLAELWSIMQFLNPGLLGTASDFRRRFAVPVERYRDEGAAALLKRLTGPFVLRRLKTDRGIIADLPEKVEMKVYCNITREQATLYQAVLDDMLARIDAAGEDIERRGLVLATMMKLKQVLNHPLQLLRDGSRVDGRSGKLARLEEILEEAVAEGDRALLFTQFAEMGELLRGHLRSRLGREVPFLHGGTPKRARDEMVSWFQSTGGPPLLILSLKAGGTGLNLTAANHVIHFDRWWNPAVEDQATDRAFRIGQRRDVQVRKLVCVGTLEERIDQVIEEKRELAERIVGTGEGWLTELSTARLRELVALSADAVAEG
ncbi:MAG TPA: DEAD/DEAH box helicase [Candidatus Dormibacteraeota bacterium]|nr:DEAD/DEAH box helicase [Candidatus Dormibacteraeota bacterium]